MPYQLLQRLSVSSKPVKLVKKDEIDKVAILKEAGLVVADLPQVLSLEGHKAYAGAALVHSLTAAGIQACQR